MKGFPNFTPLSLRVPIQTAMANNSIVKNDPRLNDVFNAVRALPDEQFLLVVDLMRSLDNLTKPDEHGRAWPMSDAVRIRIDALIDDPDQSRDLRNIFSPLSTEECQTIGSAFYIQALDNEQDREITFSHIERG